MYSSINIIAVKSPTRLTLGYSNFLKGFECVDQIIVLVLFLSS